MTTSYSKRSVSAAAAATVVAAGSLSAVLGVAEPAAAAPAYSIWGYTANSYEIAQCTFDPAGCALSQSSASAAKADTLDRFGNDKDNWRGNAFKHSSWNVRMSVVTGSRGTADTFATAHERPIGSSNPPGTNVANRAERMDLCNNRRGRDLPSNTEIFWVDQLTGVKKAEKEARKLSTDRAKRDVLISTRSCNGDNLVLIAKDNGTIIT